jgi:uncharacterized membrane protein
LYKALTETHLKPNVLHVLPALALLTAAAASAQTFTFQTIEVPGATTTQTVAFEPDGSVIGYYSTNFLKIHGLIDDAGTFRTLDLPGGNTLLVGANANYLIGRTSKTLSPITQGFSLNAAGTVTAIQVPGASSTYPAGIDASNRIFGYYNVPSGVPEEQGFILVNGVYKTFNVPNSNDTEVNCINQSGQIVGAYRLASSPTFNGFLYQNGKFTTISYPGAYQTSVQGINDAGEIVGYYSTAANSGNRGFVLKGTTFTSFAAPGATSTYAYGIDYAGRVAGFGLTPSGPEFGFIATPAE